MYRKCGMIMLKVNVEVWKGVEIFGKARLEKSWEEVDAGASERLTKGWALVRKD